VAFGAQGPGAPLHAVDSDMPGDAPAPDRDLIARQRPLDIAARYTWRRCECNTGATAPLMDQAGAIAQPAMDGAGQVAEVQKAIEVHASS